MHYEDIHARGFGVDNGAFFECFIPTHLATAKFRCYLCSIDMNLRRNVNIYGDCVRNITSASYILLEFSTFDSLGREATIFYSHLVDLLAVQHNIQ